MEPQRELRLPIERGRPPPFSDARRCAMQRTGGGAKGETARDARATVPDIAIREQRPELYVATHHAIARAVDTVLPRAVSRSIDELSADLDAGDDPRAILASVKEAIRAAVGPIITVSCAVAPSAYLAKTAAEANKPDAAIVWRREDIRARQIAAQEQLEVALGPELQIIVDG